MSWRLLLRYLRPHRGQVGLLGAILVVTIAVQLAAPLVAGRFVDAAQGSGGRLVALALLAVALAVVGQGAAVAETWVAERLAWGTTNALREELTAHVLGLDAAFHAAHRPGELIERVDGDVGTVARLFSRFAVTVVGNALLILGILGLLIAVDWRVGLAVTLLAGAAFVAMLRLRTTATPHSAVERQAAADVYGFLGEYLAGLEDIRASDARAFVLRRYAGLMRAWLAAKVRAGMYGYGIVAVSAGLFGLGTALALALAAAHHRDGALTIGAVFLVYRYTEMLRHPTEQIRNEVQDLQQAAAGLGRIERLLAERSRLVDGPRAGLPPGPLGIEVEDVRFGYQPGEPVLRGVSLRVEPGRVLGVLGRTGSGKTTLTRLLPRFFDPDAGAVRLGGVDVREVAVAALRARIGLVTQQAHLFHASLRDNLTLFDDGVPDARLAEVLDELALGPWLRGLPAGLDTVLDAGGTLSAGEVQVLACARVLLRDPDIVILDEPSSRLDPATERTVHRALARLLAGRTGIVVAHRLSTFALADDLLVLDGGEVVEHGPRAALAADPDSRYAAMLRLAAQEVAA